MIKLHEIKQFFCIFLLILKFKVTRKKKSSATPNQLQCSTALNQHKKSNSPIRKKRNKATINMLEADQLIYVSKRLACSYRPLHQIMAC